jgi:hypothetical protein
MSFGKRLASSSKSGVGGEADPLDSLRRNASTVKLGDASSYNSLLESIGMKS